VEALHSRLIVETLIEELKLEATDEEVEEEIDGLASPDGSDLQEFIDYYKDETMREYLKEDIKERKFFDILLERNVIKTGEKVNFTELVSHHNHGRDNE
jgi:trigger factor